MNPYTGELLDLATPEIARAAACIPVMRDLTAKERFDKKIQMYRPCACGSGRKFRFCCFRKPAPEGGATSHVGTPKSGGA